MPSRKKRSRLFVHRRTQWALLRSVAFYWVMYHLVLWNVMFIFRFFQYRGEMLAGRNLMTFGELYGEFARTHLAVPAAACLLLPIVVWETLQASHRILGPLVRLREALLSLARGERPAPLHFRRSDFLHDIKDAFNANLNYSASASQSEAPLEVPMLRMPGDELIAAFVPEDAGIAAESEAALTPHYQG